MAGRGTDGDVWPTCPSGSRAVYWGVSSVEAHHPAGARRPVCAADESGDDEPLGGGHDAGRCGACGGGTHLRPGAGERAPGRDGLA